jgi:hypothetical protein
MSDRLTLSDAIEDAGIERAKAERIASVIIDLIHDNVATKADVLNMETSLRGELRKVETRLSAEITRIADRTLIRLSGVMVVLPGILFAALKWHS